MDDENEKLPCNNLKQIPPAAAWTKSGILPADDLFFITDPVNNDSLSDQILTINKDFEKSESGDTPILEPVQKYKPLEAIGFHKLMSTFLVTGQLFGLLPVVGITEPSFLHVKFKWLTWRMLYVILSTMAAIIITILCFIRVMEIGLNFQKSISLAFYLTASSTAIVFLRLALRWPSLVRYVSRYELSSPDYARGEKLMKLCKWICFWIMFLATFEHILSKLAVISMARECHPNRPILESFFLHSWPQVFRIIKYAYWKGILVELINLQTTFTWNFMDLFIILISCYLRDRFQEINDRLQMAEVKLLPEWFWESVRKDYCRLANTVKIIDMAISEIVLLSFANNLYFICLQLYNSIKPLHGAIPIAYFIFSFTFLIGRSLAVCLYVASVNTASREPIYILNAVPTCSYYTEVQRLQLQARSDIIALTGLGFFNITKGLVLTIAGTIITYELVLVQFNSNDGSKSWLEECSYQSTAA